MAGEEKGGSVKEAWETGRDYWLHRCIVRVSIFYGLFHAVHQPCALPLSKLALCRAPKSKTFLFFTTPKTETKHPRSINKDDSDAVARCQG